MPYAPPSLAALQSHVGRSISDICDNGFDAASQSHCAHFVGHALGLQIGCLCGDMKFATRHTGAGMRCNELFNALPRTGRWDDLQNPPDGVLVFVLSARYMTDGRMPNIANKHVGIHHGGRIFNYSNTRREVVSDPSVSAFHAKFRSQYRSDGQDITLYYGLPE